MKPYIHAQNSVKKWKGKVEDYLKIHDWFDQTKSHFGDNRHRTILHSSFGIFLAESVFGHNIKNSDGVEVSVRDIGEQHVWEDLGFIPSVSDYLQHLEHQPWMSRQKTEDKKPENEVYDGTRPLRDAEPIPSESPFRDRVWPKFPPVPITPNVDPWPPSGPPNPWRPTRPYEDLILPRTID